MSRTRNTTTTTTTTTTATTTTTTITTTTTTTTTTPKTKTLGGGVRKGAGRNRTVTPRVLDQKLVEKARRPSHNIITDSETSAATQTTGRRADTTCTRTLAVFTAVVLVALAVVALHVARVLHQPQTVVLALVLVEVLARVLLLLVCSQHTNAAGVIPL